MSMYEVVFPDPNRVDRISTMLALLAYETPDEDEAARYVAPILALRLRDMWIEKHPYGPVLAVYTRNGGGNREHYHDGDDTRGCIACAGEAATEHPAYLRDADDDFDPTYRTYWFAFPPSLPPEFHQAIATAASDPIDMSAVWQRLIDAMADAVRLARSE